MGCAGIIRAKNRLAALFHLVSRCFANIFYKGRTEYVVKPPSTSVRGGGKSAPRYSPFILGDYCSFKEILFVFP